MLPLHLARFVVKPALAVVAGGNPAFESDVAVWLVVGTMATESRFMALDQITGPGDKSWGPAYGLGQMERATADDIWTTWLAHRPDWSARVRTLLAPWPDRTIQLATNLSYAAVMIRLRYWREPQCRMPARIDPLGYAALWKRFYNTPAGRGTEPKFVSDWKQLVAPFLVETL